MNTETGSTSLLQVLWIHNFCVKSSDYETKSNKLSVSAEVLKEEMLYWKQTETTEASFYFLHKLRIRMTSC